MRNFCDKREQLSLLKLLSEAKILSKAKNSQFEYTLSRDIFIPYPTARCKQTASKKTAKKNTHSQCVLHPLASSKAQAMCAVANRQPL